MTKICFVTGTRADYGILSSLMRAVKDSNWAELQIIATNMHLSEAYGMTVNEIISDGFTVNCRVDMNLHGDSPCDTVKSMGAEMFGLADALQQLKPDLLVILGDRYEMLIVASAALIFHIPVVHLHGGEITEGAIDDAIRNAITQLSTVHFTSTEEYRKRVVAMGANPKYAANTGALGVQNIANEVVMQIDELNATLRNDYKEREYLLVTFHPVTKQPGEEARQTKALLEALDAVMQEDSNLKILFTMPNSDTGGQVVAELIELWASTRTERVECVKSLGRKRYYSALKYAKAVVGNSSSGLIEAPEFRIPTVNIGDRQKGRAKGNSVLDCEANAADITATLRKALSNEYREYCRDYTSNPYKQPDTLERMLTMLRNLSEEIAADELN